MRERAYYAWSLIYHRAYRIWLCPKSHYTLSPRDIVTKVRVVRDHNVYLKSDVSESPFYVESVCPEEYIVYFEVDVSESLLLDECVSLLCYTMYLESDVSENIL